MSIPLTIGGIVLLGLLSGKRGKTKIRSPEQAARDTFKKTYDKHDNPGSIIAWADAYVRALLVYKQRGGSDKKFIDMIAATYPFESNRPFNDSVTTFDQSVLINTLYFPWKDPTWAATTTAYSAYVSFGGILTRTAYLSKLAKVRKIKS